MSKTPTGRAALAFTDKAEHAAFGAWLTEAVHAYGGRKAVSEAVGASLDSVTKWCNARAIPSKVYVRKLIGTGVIPFESLESLTLVAPWQAPEYQKTRKKAKPAVNQEVSPEPVQVAPVNLIDAVMAEPGLSAKQRAQLAALVAMVVNGVQLDVVVSPRSVP